ncbi:hypothetical protein N7462_010598 [Penicillium macrosclerotiorum]|uniref:uncharacterized protein n=1 Tax=Penicillium macrosclerotiorum TaxID=303699 RepID=UPI0025483E41|nr:uncharacterized protein N7462_010598 [Penicillium macrosclerotiorum]KAJ5669528.1 hypothetical protein N7462_010598 [Penicillium macrosclerotiorum]
MTPWWYTASSTLLLSSLGAAAWPYASYSSIDFQPPKLEVNTTGTTEPGYLFLGPRGSIQPAGTAALIYDNEGNLVYEGPEEVTANFRVQQLNGSDVITFWAGDMMSLGYGYGTVHILDNTYKEIHTVTLTGPFVTPDNSIKDSYIDLHESHITPRNTLLVTAYNLTQHDLTSLGGNSSEWMLDSHFYEIDISTNQILNSWSALDHEDQIPLTSSHQKLGKDVGTQDAPYDAYHINAITPTNNGYLVSLRHMWSGYYLFQNGTIMWQVSGEDGGDFAQVGNANFSWQHDMRVYNETDEGLVLNLFNNANTPTDTADPTTGVSLAIDLVQKKVTGLRSLSDPNDPIHSVSQGSYQLLNEVNGHVFMDYGSISKVKEYDGDGNVVFSAQFGEDNAVASYRGYRAQWSAVPFWKPSLNVTRTASGATVYMSWNGATDYDNWVVYSATSETSTNNTQIGAAKRNGFETIVTLTSPPSNYIQVVARQGNNVLGTSEIVSF